MMARTGVALLLLAALGCSQRELEQTNPGMPQQNDGGLASSVQVEVNASSVRLVFHVTNPSNQPVVLEFGTGQRYDFAVQRVEPAPGGEIWRWSSDRMFTQALGSETIPAGGSITYSETWQSGNVGGRYIAIGELKSLNYPLQQRAEFERRLREGSN